MKRGPRQAQVVGHDDGCVAFTARGRKKHVLKKVTSFFSDQKARDYWASSLRRVEDRNTNEGYGRMTHSHTSETERTREDSHLKRSSGCDVSGDRDEFFVCPPIGNTGQVGGCSSKSRTTDLRLGFFFVLAGVSATAVLLYCCCKILPFLHA